METVQPTKPVIIRILLGSLTAGVVAAALNNAYSVIYSQSTEQYFPEIINFGSITGASVIPAIFAGLIYYILSRFTHWATRIFIVSTLILTALSLTGTMQSQLPDGTPTPHGFTALTLPMHIIAGLAIAFIIPRFVKNKN